MVRTFIQERETKWNEIIQIDTETEKVKIYSVDKTLGFPFSEYYTTVKEMGYKYVKDILKRMKSRKNEIETDKQMASEISGLLKLAKYRAKNNNHAQPDYYDIVVRLKYYGIDETDAIQKIGCSISSI